jgi:hypothetical protein
LKNTVGTHGFTLWGYEARPSQASENIKNTVGTHGFGKPCIPTSVLYFLKPGRV